MRVFSPSSACLAYKYDSLKFDGELVKTIGSEIDGQTVSLKHNQRLAINSVFRVIRIGGNIEKVRPVRDDLDFMMGQEFIYDATLPNGPLKGGRVLVSECAPILPTPEEEFEIIATPKVPRAMAFSASLLDDYQSAIEVNNIAKKRKIELGGEAFLITSSQKVRCGILSLPHAWVRILGGKHSGKKIWVNVIQRGAIKIPDPYETWKPPKRK